MSPLREQRRSRKEYDAGPQSADAMGFGIVCIINIDHRSKYFLFEEEEDVDIFSTTSKIFEEVEAGEIILFLWIFDFYCL